jgi:VWFA-related protein
MSSGPEPNFGTVTRLGACAGTILALALADTRAVPQVPPTFPTEVELVRIDAVVLDGRGQPVTGLTADDFEVTENGRLHELVSFEPIVVRSASSSRLTGASPPPISESLVPAPEENRLFLVFFDDVHVSAVAAERVRAQLVPFLQEQTRAGDWVTVLSPLAGLRYTARTAFERSQLPAVVRSLKGQLVRRVARDDPDDFAAMRVAEYAGREPKGIPLPGSSFSVHPNLLAQEVYAVAKRRLRQSLAALQDAIRSVAGFRGRKSVVFYSEGFIKSPSRSDYDRTIDLARRAHVAVYVVDPRGLGSGLPMSSGDDGGPTLIDLDTKAGGSSYVAAATGGRVSTSNDVTALFQEAAVEASAYYLIGFAPSAVPSGERKLKVRVRREGLEVRAPDRYVVGQPEARGRAVPPAVEALNSVADAIAIPVRVGALFLAPSPGDKVATTIAVELDKSRTETVERRLTLLVEARPLGRGEAVRVSAEVAVPAGVGRAVATRELQLAPGVWQTRVVLRDALTERLGSALHTFEVPAAAGLRLSSPLLTDEVEDSGVPRPRLRLDRHYRSGGTLYCQYRVFGAALGRGGKPHVTASYTMRRADQTAQRGEASVIEPARDGQLLRLLGFGLAGFPPGDYLLELHISDEVSGQSIERREPFAIVPAEE